MLQNFVDLEVFQKLAIDYNLKDPCAVQSMEKCANEIVNILDIYAHSASEVCKMLV